MVFVTVDDTGKTAELLEKALNGPVPLVIVTVLGTPEKTVTAAGSTVRMGETTGGTYGLFGAPLPPPQPASEKMPASAKRASAGRSQAVKRFFHMSGFP